MRTTPTIISIPEANCSLRTIGLYLVVYYRLARLTAIRSGETAFYSLVCQLQTYAVCCCHWLEYLLDDCWTIFYQIFYPRLVCTGSAGPIVSLLVTEV